MDDVTVRDEECVSIVEGIEDLLGRDLMTGPVRFRKPFARRPASRQAPAKRRSFLGLAAFGGRHPDTAPPPSHRVH